MKSIIFLFILLFPFPFLFSQTNDFEGLWYNQIRTPEPNTILESNCFILVQKINNAESLISISDYRNSPNKSVNYSGKGIVKNNELNFIDQIQKIHLEISLSFSEYGSAGFYYLLVTIPGTEGGFGYFIKQKVTK